MNFAKVVKNRFFSKDPFFLVLYVTARCNARCKMCYYWDEIVAWKSRPQLTLDEIEKITLNINSLQQLTISGGEPFLREELAEICTLFSRNCDVQFITIPTNLVLTGKTEIIMNKALKQNPNVVFRVGCSVPEINEELEELYGVKDAFKHHQETFKMLTKLKKTYPNLAMDTGTVFNKYNADRVREIVDYVCDHMPETNPHVSVVRGKPRLEDAHDISLDELESIYDYTKATIPRNNNRPFANFFNIMQDMVREITIETLRHKKMIIPCKAGEKLLVIYDNGEVHPCELLDDSLGNVRDYDYNLHKVLARKESKKITKKIVEDKCHCTWECANNNNIVFSNKFTIELAMRLIKSKLGLYPPKSKAAPIIPKEKPQTLESPGLVSSETNLSENKRKQLILQ